MNVHPCDPVFPSGNMTMLETPQQFGIWIRQRRKALDLSQEELAFLVDVGRRFITDLEAGKPTCQLGKALAVARALGARLADAREGGEGPAAPPPADPDDSPCKTSAANSEKSDGRVMTAVTILPGGT